MDNKNLKRLTWFIIGSVEAAILLFAFVSITRAQVRNAPPYEGPMNGDVYFPVTNRGFNYSVTGQQLRDSLGGGGTDTNDLQHVTDRGNVTTNQIWTPGVILSDTTQGHYPLIQFIMRNPDYGSAAIQSDENSGVVQFYPTASHDSSLFSAPFVFYSEVQGKSASHPDNFVTLGQMQDSICGNSCVKNIGNSDMHIKDTGGKNIRNIFWNYADGGTTLRVGNQDIMANFPLLDNGGYLDDPYLALGEYSSAVDSNKNATSIYMGFGYNSISMSEKSGNRYVNIAGDDGVRLISNMWSRDHDTLLIGNNQGFYYNNMQRNSDGSAVMSYKNQTLTLGKESIEYSPFYKFGYGVEMYTSGSEIAISTGQLSNPMSGGGMTLSAGGGLNFKSSAPISLVTSAGLSLAGLGSGAGFSLYDGNFQATIDTTAANRTGTVMNPGNYNLTVGGSASMQLNPGNYQLTADSIAKMQFGGDMGMIITTPLSLLPASADTQAATLGQVRDTLQNYFAKSDTALLLATKTDLKAISDTINRPTPNITTHNEGVDSVALSLSEENVIFKYTTVAILPAADSAPGKVYRLVSTYEGGITVSPGFTDTKGNPATTLIRGQWVYLQSDGTDWVAIMEGGN